MFASTKTLKIMSATVYQVNRSIQDSNKEKCSYYDAVIMVKSSTWLKTPGWFPPQNLEIHVSNRFSKQEKLVFKETETSIFWGCAVITQQTSARSWAQWWLLPLQLCSNSSQHPLFIVTGFVTMFCLHIM